MIDSRLKEWATPRDVQILDAIESEGSERKAARALGLSPGTISNAVAKLRARAARQGYSPEHDMTRTAPDGFYTKGVSSYINKKGELAGQWVKTNIDLVRQE